LVSKPIIPESISTIAIDVTSEILKRTAYLDFPPLSDEDLMFNAEEIFLQLDALLEILQKCN
jgi:hypothetical protein